MIKTLKVLLKKIKIIDNNANQTKVNEDSEHHKIQESEEREDTGLNDSIQGNFSLRKFYKLY